VDVTAGEIKKKGLKQLDSKTTMEDDFYSYAIRYLGFYNT